MSTPASQAASVGSTPPQTSGQKIVQCFKGNFDVWKMLWVIVALLIFVGGPLFYFTFFAKDHLAWAGIIIASIGKLVELLSKSKEVSHTTRAKDGFALFGEGVTFFGVLMVLGATVFGFEYKN